MDGGSTEGGSVVGITVAVAGVKGRVGVGFASGVIAGTGVEVGGIALVGPCVGVTTMVGVLISRVWVGPGVAVLSSSPLMGVEDGGMGVSADTVGPGVPGNTAVGPRVTNGRVGGNSVSVSPGNSVREGVEVVSGPPQAIATASNNTKAMPALLMGSRALPTCSSCCLVCLANSRLLVRIVIFQPCRAGRFLRRKALA